jgi:hypothetical protein
MSHRQTFTGVMDRVFADLQVGRNAEVERASGAPLPEGSTVLLSPGDVLITPHGVDHPELTAAAPAVAKTSHAATASNTTA